MVQHNTAIKPVTLGVILPYYASKHVYFKRKLWLNGASRELKTFLFTVFRCCVQVGILIAPANSWDLYNELIFYARHSFQL